MAQPEISLEELTRFGIHPDDESPHRASPDHAWWNESVFFDWIDADGQSAGHCRIGWHPNQERAWVWLFLKRGDEWLGIEEPRLPLGGLQLPEIAYDGWGLRFGWRAIDPLRRSHLSFSGFARVLAGPRTGMVLPVSLALDIEAMGTAYSRGEAEVPGHSAEGYSANRFEQPTGVEGRVSIDGETRSFQGHGERDRSWGPRDWNIEWTFLVLNGAAFRLQAAEVYFPALPDVGPVRVGYLHRESSQSLTDVDFRFSYDDGDVLRCVSGPFSLKAEDGSTLAGTLEPLGATEIDITHTFEPPRRSLYRRALVRFTSQGRDEPALGWLEFNRFLEGPGERSS